MKRLILGLSIILIMLSGCAKQPVVTNLNSSVFYEIFVHSFYDTNNDGIGDLNGVTKKLDYLENLGIKAIWLMPIMPSPTYHKYDVTDYLNVDSSYGNLDDFRQLIESANEHHIDVIIDLVLNHTSSQHPWFIEAKKNVLSNTCNESQYCDYYNFFEERRPNTTQLGKAYYESVFWEEMPDLNLDNENVRKEIKEIVTFWLDMGVKGFRLDATTHYYEGNNTKNIEFMNWLSDVVKEKNPDAYLVGEAWSSENVILDLYQSKMDSFFDFSLSGTDGALVKNMRQKDGVSLAKTIAQHYQAIEKVNRSAVNAPFLSNHDNARSYGYFINPQQRKLAESIYLLLPGTPYIYYGEEIGLKGSGKDENKRLPFLWDESQTGQCYEPSDADYDTPSTMTLAIAMEEEDSLYSYIKKIIEIRNQHDFKNATVEAIDTGIKEIMMMKLTNDTETFYVIHNLNDVSVQVELSDVEMIHSLDQASDNNCVNNQITISAYSTIICK